MTKIGSLKKGQKASEKSALVSLALAIVKAVIGMMSGSLALMTSALDSFADFMVMLASWFGLRISRRDPSKKFPYGYYKAESVTTLFISLVIVYAAVQLLIGGYVRLFSVPEITMPALAAVIALVSCVVSFFLARHLSGVGRSINSQLLVASSKERYMDVASSLLVFLAIAASYYRIPYAEGAVTIGISVLILRVGLMSVKDSIFSLMDVSPSAKTERKTSRMIRSVKGVEDLRDLKLRKSGPFIFGEAKVMVKKFVKVERAHEIADNIENLIKGKVKQVDSFTVHIEPYRTDKQRVAIPVLEKLGMKSPVMPKFGRADYFAFVEMDKKKVTGIRLKKNPFKKREIKAGLAAANFIVKEKADVLVTKEVGEISFHIMRDHLVDIYSSEGRTVQDIIDKLRKGELKRLESHTRDGD